MLTYQTPAAREFRPACVLTFYPSTTGRNADGTSYGGNRIAAHRRFHFGDTVRVGVPRKSKKHGKSATRWRVFVVADRGDLVSNQFDLPIAEFAYLVGSDWREKGRVTARYEIVRRARKTRR